MSGPFDDIHRKSDAPVKTELSSLDNERLPARVQLSHERVDAAAAAKATAKGLPEIELQQTASALLNRVESRANPATGSALNIALGTKMMSMQQKFLGTEAAATRYQIAKNFTVVNHEIDSRILLPTAAITAGVQGLALKSDLQKLASSHSFKQEMVYGVAAGFDAVALAGSAMSLVPGTRKLAMPVMLGGSFARLLTAGFE